MSSRQARRHREKGRGLSRRDLLKHGGQTILGLALVPTFEKYLSLTQAWGAGAPGCYLHFKLHGGYSFVSDFQGLSSAGAGLSAAAYQAHGAPQNGVDPTWGAPLWNGPKDGTMASLKRILNAFAIDNKVQFATFAAKHNDDISSWVDPLQYIASYLNQKRAATYRTVSNLSYGGSDLQAVDGFTPVIVNDDRAYLDLKNPKPGPLAPLNAAQLGALAGYASTITNRFLARIAAQATGVGTLANGMKSGYASAQAVAAAGMPSPPQSDSRIAARFGNTGYNLSGPGIFAAAGGYVPGQTALMALLKLILDGDTQAVAFDVPGLPGVLPDDFARVFGPYDLHIGDGGVVKDPAAAYNAGMWFYRNYLVPAIAVLVDAHIPFYIDITTDGSIGWTGAYEDGGKPQVEGQKYSMVVSVAYNPSGGQPFVTHRVGGYLADTGAIDVNADIVSASEHNTAMVRAASAIKFFGFDVTQDAFLRPVAGNAITNSMG